MFLFVLLFNECISLLITNNIGFKKFVRGWGQNEAWGVRRGACSMMQGAGCG